MGPKRLALFTSNPSLACRMLQRGKHGRALRMGQQLALERGVLLAKLLVNLHVYVEGSCSPELKAREIWVARG